MSYFLYIISKKNFLPWELEQFLTIHPKCPNTIVKSAMYFAYDSRPELLYKKQPTQDDPTLKVVIGRGYISKTTGYSQADGNDWVKLLNRDYTPSDIDGHYVALRIREDWMQATGDIWGHCPIYYATANDYCIVSNRIDYIAPLVEQKDWNHSAIAALALQNIPIVRQSYLKTISMLPFGHTLTLKKHKFIETPNNITTPDPQSTEEYFFSLKKAFEMEQAPADFMSIAFETNNASQFAFSVWAHKPKKLWGLYHLKGSDFVPEKYLDPYILSSLKIVSIPPLSTASGDEIFALYKDYIITTGLADFTELFSLAGRFKPEKGIHEINLISSLSDWLFEKDPTMRVERLYNTIKNGIYSEFKKNYIFENEVFDKEFFAILQKGIDIYFKELVLNIRENSTSLQSFYVNSFLANNHSSTLAYLNNFRTFFSPGMLYSLTNMHLAQWNKDQKIGLTIRDLPETFAEESLDFPYFKDTKWTFPELPNLNQIYFPLITSQIGLLIAAAEKIPYYNHSALVKLFKKAKKGNQNAINSILRWTRFEILRKYFE